VRAPIPPVEPIALPLPAGIFEVLLLVSFAAHVLAVDVAVGGTILAVVHWWKGKRSAESGHFDLSLGIARMLPTAIALLVNLAIPPLLFLQVLYGPAFYTSSVLMAVPWIAIIPLLMGGYLLSYRLRGAMEAKSPWVLPIGIGSALCLLCIGFFLVNEMTLMLRPEAWTAAYRSSVHGVHLNLSEHTLVQRYAHMVTGMLAGAGAFVAVLSTFPGSGLDPAFARRAGLRWFAFATMANLVVGPIFFFSQPARLRALYLGGSTGLTVALWGAVALAVLAVVTALRGQDPARGKAAVWIPAGLVSLTVAGMTVVRHGIRQHSLARVGYRFADQPVRPDWRSFGIFLAVVALGLFVIWKMFSWVRADLAKKGES
jgi:hypothetical protein